MERKVFTFWETIFSLIVNDNLLGKPFYIVGSFFFFQLLKMSCHYLLVCKVAAEKLADSRIGFPLYVTHWFLFASFKIASLFLTFAILTIACLGVAVFWFILFGIVCASCTWMFASFTSLGNLSAIISLKFLFHLLWGCLLCERLSSSCHPLGPLS